jgi:hypothetical protein
MTKTAITSDNDDDVTLWQKANVAWNSELIFVQKKKLIMLIERVRQTTAVMAAILFFLCERDGKRGSYLKHYCTFNAEFMVEVDLYIYTLGWVEKGVFSQIQTAMP